MKELVLLIPALIFSFLSNPANGQDWKWLNPQPTGNSLRNLCHTDADTWYALGILGTIIKTKDGGTTWTRLSTGTQTSFWDITFVNASTGFGVGENQIFKTTDEGKTWTAHQVAISPLVRVDFPDANTGYAVSNFGGIVKTIDGGIAWNVISDGGILNCSMLAVKFINKDTGFISGQTYNVDSRIIKTTDGGNTWNTCWVNTYGISGNIFSFFFTSSNTGFAAGDYGTILKTADGGSSWSLISGGSPEVLCSIDFPDKDTGYIFADGSGTIRKSTDGGNTWMYVTPSGNNSFGIGKFSDANTGIIIGAIQYPEGTISKIYKTTNGGNSIISLNTDVYANLYSISFPADNIGYAAGDSGLIVKTSDAGAHWTRLNSGTSSPLNSLSFPSVNKGYAVGDSGTVLRTSDAGINWTRLVSGSTQKLHSVSFPNDNVGFAVGDWGTFLKTSNGGGSWETLNSGTTRFLYSVHFINEQTGYVVGSYGTIRKTADGGATWAEQSSGTTNDLTSVCFVNENIGYSIGQGYTILKTTNGGITWEDISQGFYSGGLSVYFMNENTGYIVASGGYILFTNDGGVTWTRQVSGIDKTLRGVCITSEKKTYAVGDLGSILGSEVGGMGINSNPGTSKPGIVIYPNPSSDKITLETSGTGHLSIHSLNGQELLTHQITEPTTTIDISTLPSGVYFVRLTKDKTVEVGKFIKQ